MKPTQTLVNSEVLLGFDDFVKNLGIDSGALYKQFGVSLELIECENVKLPFAIVAGLLEIAAKLSQQEDFSLNFATAQRKLNTRSFSPKMYQFDDLSSVLVAALEHYNLPGSELNWAIQMRAKKVYLTRLERLNHKVNGRHYSSLVMARCLSNLQEMCGKNWRPLALSFSFDTPNNIQPYLRYFGVPVKFDHEHTQIVFSSESLTNIISLNHSNITQESVSTLYRSDPELFLAQVHSLVRQAIHKGVCTPNVVAKILSMNTKKLQRTLNKLDSNFQDIRHQIKLEEAAYYLKNSAIPIIQIAEILGYSEASALSRAFKDKYGVTPSNWRKNYRFN